MVWAPWGLVSLPGVDYTGAGDFDDPLPYVQSGLLYSRLSSDCVSISTVATYLAVKKRLQENFKAGTRKSETDCLGYRV